MVPVGDIVAFNGLAYYPVYVYDNMSNQAMGGRTYGWMELHLHDTKL